MAGHNKWSQIKHKKGAADARRGKVFTRLAKEITIAAREGGSDVTANPRLRTAIQSAKGVNMPKDNIEKAIKKGTGEIEGVNYEEIMYEGYGHGGVAILVEALTDNKNRTVAEVRHIFSKYGGNMAEGGAVSWNFEKKGMIDVLSDGLEEDDFMMQALDLGAEDIEITDGIFIVYTVPTDLYKVVGLLDDNGFKVQKAEFTMIPKTTINADDVAEGLLKLIDKLEDIDDIQKLYSNFELSDEVMNRF